MYGAQQGIRLLHALAMVVRHDRRDDGAHGAESTSVSGGSMQRGKAGHEPTSAGCRRDSHGHLALEELAAHSLWLTQVLSDLHRVHARTARCGCPPAYGRHAEER